MPFSPKTWLNGAGGGTPLSAAALNELEDRVHSSFGEAGKAVRGIFKPGDWGSVWFPKLAAAGSAPATVAIVGDSIAQGYDAAPMRTDSWVGLMRDSLQATYGDGGSGYVSSLYAQHASDISTNMHLFSDALACTGGGAGPAAWDVTPTPKEGPSAGNLFSQTTSATVTFPVRGTRIRVYYLTFVSGSANLGVTIDGNAQADISVNTGATSVASIDYTVAAGSHTVVITSRGSAGVFSNVLGVEGRNTTGVVVNNFGHSGATADTFNNATGFTYGPAGQWSGGTSYPADLVIYALGVNDARANVAEATYIDNVRGYLNSVDLGATDVLFVMPHIGTFEQTTKPYHRYCERMRGIAESYGAAMINLWAIYRNSYAAGTAVNLWSNGHTGTGASGSDIVHPGDTGHGLYAGIITPVVNGTA